MAKKSSYKESELKKANAIMQTSLGDFIIELDIEKAPETCWNFINLVEGRQDTVKTGCFYEGIIFHRVIKGFMIQAGCPLGTGTGGPGYEFANEYHPGIDFTEEGTMAMANRGRDTNGSQFFITLEPNVQLNSSDYTVFGKVIQGMDIIKNIGDLPVDPRMNHRPYEDVTIVKVDIIR